MVGRNKLKLRRNKLKLRRNKLKLRRNKLKLRRNKLKLRRVKSNILSFSPKHYTSSRLSDSLLESVGSPNGLLQL